MVRYAAAIGAALAVVLVATGGIGQTPHAAGRFARPAELAAPVEPAAADLAALGDRVDGLERLVATLAEQLVADQANGLAALTAQLAALETRFDALQPAGDEATLAAIAELADRLDGLIAGQIALAARIADFEAGLANAAVADDPDRAALEARVAALEARIDALAAAEATAAQAAAVIPPPDLTAIEAELAALRNDIAALAPVDPAAELAAAISAILAAEGEILAELRRLTAQPPAAEAGAAAGTDAPVEPVAEEPATPSFGDELMLRLYGLAADLKRGLGGG